MRIYRTFNWGNNYLGESIARDLRLLGAPVGGTTRACAGNLKQVGSTGGVGKEERIRETGTPMVSSLFCNLHLEQQFRPEWVDNKKPCDGLPSSPKGFLNRVYLY